MSVKGDAVVSTDTLAVHTQYKEKKDTPMRYVLLWALGVPISGLIVLHLLGLI